MMMLTLSPDAGSQDGAGDVGTDGRRSPHVAHAGGRVNGRAYTNSLDALDANYARGFRVFELDFAWTVDGELVLIHDWEWAWEILFESAGAEPTLASFLSAPMNFGLRRMTPTVLFEWMEAHQDAEVITDIKDNNLDGLKLISELAPRLTIRIIPQIYAPEELEAVRELGFERVVFTAYQSKLSESQIVDFALESGLYAVTIPEHRAIRGDFMALVERGGPPIYVHTINDLGRWNLLKRHGYFGAYTDDLIDD